MRATAQLFQMASAPVLFHFQSLPATKASLLHPNQQKNLNDAIDIPLLPGLSVFISRNNNQDSSITVLCWVNYLH